MNEMSWRISLVADLDEKNGCRSILLSVGAASS